MKITDLRCHVMCPIQDDLDAPRSRTFVEVDTDAGITGIGEATTEFHEMAVKTQIEVELKNRFVGEDPTDVERLWQIGYRDFWWRRGLVHTSAMSGVDMALWVEPALRLKRDFPDVPIAVGERLITRWDCRPWFEQQAIDVCQANISHTGGISELMKIAHVAEVYGIRLAPHNPYGPVALAAVAQVAAAIPNFDMVEHCPIQPWFDDVQTLELPLTAGYIDIDELGRRAGLGVELDMAFVRSRNRFVPSGGQGYQQADGSLPLI